MSVEHWFTAICLRRSSKRLSDCRLPNSINSDQLMTPFAVGLPVYWTIAFRCGSLSRTFSIFSNCSSSSTTIIFASLWLAQYWQASGEFVVYIPRSYCKKSTNNVGRNQNWRSTEHQLQSVLDVPAANPPAKIAPKSEINHSGALNPIIQTAW